MNNPPSPLNTPLPTQPVAHPDPDHVELPAAPTPKAGTVVGIFAGVVLLFAALFAAGLAPKLVRARELRAAAAEVGSGVPRVEVVKPHMADGNGTITLPGSIEPLRETWIYARANGFVRKWEKDIGESVEEGQPLLELDTPEIDAELGQAQANLAQAQTAVEQAKANRELAKITSARYEKLGPQGVASQQDVEEKRTQFAVAEVNVKAAEAAVDSQRANVNRLLDLKSFAKVVAPFSGRVTARNVEKGQLVNAGAAGGQGLFRLAHVDTVRVFVHVPQDLAPEVEVGQSVSISLRDSRATFSGKVTHTAGALDVATRTLNTEVQIPNDDHQLLAGMYVQASIQLGKKQQSLRVPSAALVADSHGTRLMTVDASNHLKSVPVQIGRDLGTEIEILSGLQGDEQVVTVLPEGTPEGTVVDVIRPTRT
jgi:RND family efflux transporter MFP subunit